jgi:DNA-binding NarL/FixJ family response regulator
MASETERISVLIADDTDLMRLTIAGLLKREPRIKVVAEAANYSETLALTTALQPDVLLLDLHMPDEREYPSETVRNHVLQNTRCVLAISVWNDDCAKSLAESLGAKVLLDKAKLATELIPAIRLFCAAKCGSENWSQNLSSR